MVYALVFAGGVGSRMGLELPKQFIEVEGKPIIIHTLEVFEKSDIVDKIVVVTLKDYIETVLSLAKQFKITKVIDVIPGGKTAMDSQFNGLEYLMKNAEENDIVMIHDGVRPFINHELLCSCKETALTKGNAITISPATETISILGSERNIQTILPRQQCVLARAPQVFFLKDIYNYHLLARANNQSFVDSASLVMSFGKELNVVEGPSENIKITTQYDLMLCKLWMKEKYENN